VSNSGRLGKKRRLYRQLTCVSDARIPQRLPRPGYVTMSDGSVIESSVYQIVTWNVGCDPIYPAEAGGGATSYNGIMESHLLSLDSSKNSRWPTMRGSARPSTISQLSLLYSHLPLELVNHILHIAAASSRRSNLDICLVVGPPYRTASHLQVL
jgi:hypothetical protein